MKKRFKDGYMTVEASVIMPLVMGCYLFLLLVAMYQYDRCLLEQRTAQMLLRGVTGAADSGQQMEIMRRYWTSIGQKDYLWLRPDDPYLTVRGNYATVQAGGDFPFPFGYFTGIGGKQRVELQQECIYFHPAALLRMAAVQKEDI